VVKGLPSLSVPRMTWSPMAASVTCPLLSSVLNSEYGIDFPVGVRKYVCAMISTTRKASPYQSGDDGRVVSWVFPRRSPPLGLNRGVDFGATRLLLTPV